MFETLVFSSGGINGVYYIGCLKALEEHHVLEKIKYIRGSSVGALFSVLCVLGYSSKELEEAVLNINIESLLQISIDNLLSFNETCGLDNGEKLREVCRIFFETKLQSSDITFEELYKWNPVKVTLIGTCLSTKQCCYFNHVNSPTMKVLDAMHISMCIPFVFTPVIRESLVYVDGALLDPYPVRKTNGNVLGLKIQNESSTVPKSTPISLLHFVNLLISSIRPSYECTTKNVHTIELQSTYHNFTFTLTRDQKINAIASGFSQTNSFFEKLEIEKQKKQTEIERCIKRKKVYIKMLQSKII